MTKAKRHKKTMRPGKEITISRTDTLLRKLLKIPEEGIKDLTMDFSKVNDVDVVGLGLILATHNTLSGLQGSLHLINVPKEIFHMFHAMKMDNIMNIQPA